MLRADVVLGGDWPVTGRVLRLDEPLSFWGGVDPATGRLTDPRAAAYGQSIAGTIFMVARPRGSSSSSAVILELMHKGLAPAALVLGTIDAIVGLGILVGREMGLPPLPLCVLAEEAQRRVAAGAFVSIAADGAFSEIDG